MILALGIVGLVFSWCFPVGWVCGGFALSMAGTDLVQMARGKMDKGGRGMTLAGRVCGTIAVIIASLAAVRVIVALASRRF
jgi:hypothetical protein